MDFFIDFEGDAALYRVADSTLRAAPDSLGWSTSTPSSSSSSSKSTPIYTPQGSTQISENGVSGALSTVQDLIDLLSMLSISGPLMLTNTLSQSFIGKGSQFHVYKNSWFESGPALPNETVYYTDVAVKKCIFKLTSDKRLDLSTSTARRQVHDMCLEIFALASPQLRDHRNIVKLLGYSVESETWHAAPLLVQELADGDLQHVLEDPKFNLSWDTKHQLCLDIAAGLDASHACGIVHGDLKPQNVLVFKNSNTKVPFIAKLADFGYCSTGANPNDVEVQVTGWTPGWCAPEVRQHIDEGRPISNTELMKADNYSFGLLVWAVMCRGGLQPQAERDETPAAAAAVEELLPRDAIPLSLRKTLGNALKVLLEREVSQRPAVIGDILQDESEACQAWIRVCEEYNSPPVADEDPGHEEVPEFIHPWDIPSLEPLMLVGVEKSFKTHGDGLSGAQLFAMFLWRTFQDGTSGSDPTLQVEMLIASAEKGFVPAQAVAHRVLRTHGLPFPVHISPETENEWLFRGASTGSLAAVEDLNAKDTESCERARAEFRRNGGYNQFYSPTARPTELGLPNPEIELKDIIEKQRHSRIHELAAYGCLEQLTELLDSGVDVNARNALGETALYKACAAGCLETVSLLCNRGASASIAESFYGISCLHWLSTFPSEQISTVAGLLVGAGGNPNALTSIANRIIQYHFPFTWPYGTPLHWAVATSNITAVKVLLGLGADPTLRNGEDAFKSDRNVRYLDFHHQSDHVGSFSTTPKDCKGLSAIDLAVAQHDAEIVSLLLDHGAHPDLVDEEGYTPIHRLCSNRLGRTAIGARFWHPSFLGVAADSPRRQAALLEIISQLRTNIDRLTVLRDAPFQLASGGFTPLMLAAMALDVPTAQALLALWANIDAKNSTGYTVLDALSGLQGNEPTISPQALVAFMDLFMEHYRAANRLASEAASLLKVAASIGSLGSVEPLLRYLPAGSDSKTSFLAPLMICEPVFTRDGHLLDVAERDTYLLELLRKFYIAGDDCSTAGDSSSGRGLLHSACQAGLTGCVSFLIGAGADVNAVVDGTAAITGSPLDIFVGTAAAITGTPLDFVEKKKAGLYDSIASGQSKVSRLGVQIVYERLEQVEEMLRENFGKLQIEL